MPYQAVAFVRHSSPLAVLAAAGCRTFVLGSHKSIPGIQAIAVSCRFLILSPTCHYVHFFVGLEIVIVYVTPAAFITS
jgi:hypothetical protein